MILCGLWENPLRQIGGDCGGVGSCRVGLGVLVELSEGRFDVNCDVHVSVRLGGGEELGVKEVEEVFRFPC